MHEGLPWGDSPLDFEDPDEPGLGWAAGVIFLGSALLLGLNAHALRNWADRQELTDRTALIVDAANDWYGQTGRYGLNIMVDRIKQAAQQVRKADWDMLIPSDTPAPKRP